MEHVARYHNYTSEQELIDAIASGEIATVLLGDEQRSMAVQWLKEQATHIIDPSLSEALESIARQLEAAAWREAANESEE